VTKGTEKRVGKHEEKASKGRKTKNGKMGELNRHAMRL